MKVGVASSNPGKLRELRELLGGWDVEPLDMAGIGEETGASFYENARFKAAFGRRIAPHELWVLGEDSGLEVEGLGGGPGIRSARFAGASASDEDNVRALLSELAGAPDRARRARYGCEIVVLDPEGHEYRGSGTLDGTIGHAPRGTGGFGYDPVFVPERRDETVAELGAAWKAQHSHRAKAVAGLLAAIGGPRRSER